MPGIILIILAALVTLGLAFQTDRRDRRRTTDRHDMDDREGISTRHNYYH